MSIDLNETEQSVLDGLSEKFTDALINVYQSCDHTYFVVEAASNMEICRFLKDEHHFILLCDIIGTDRYTSEDRFELIYNLMNLRTRTRIFIKITLEEVDPIVSSVTPIWTSAGWHEREVFDMFGIRFKDHPDHRRIFMPEDFEYYPLRKEFPLLGIPGSIALPTSSPDTD